MKCAVQRASYDLRLRPISIDSIKCVRYSRNQVNTYTYLKKKQQQQQVKVWYWSTEKKNKQTEKERIMEETGRAVWRDRKTPQGKGNEEVEFIGSVLAFKQTTKKDESNNKNSACIIPFCFLIEEITHTHTQGNKHLHVQKKKKNKPATYNTDTHT